MDPGGQLSNSVKNSLGDAPTFFFQPHMIGSSATNSHVKVAWLIMQ